MAADNGQQPPENIATAITEITERTTVLIREEIELAKAEVTEKITKLIKGAVVVVAAGIFVSVGLLYFLDAAAWAFYDYVFTKIFWGFLIVAGVLFLLGGIAGYLGARWLKSGSPPTPDMAIDEAQRIRETLTGDADPHLDAVAATTEAEKS